MIIYFDDSRGKDMCGIQLKQSILNRTKQTIKNYIKDQLQNQNQADFSYQPQQQQFSFIYMYCRQDRSLFILQDILPHIQSWDIDLVCFRHFLQPSLLKNLSHITFDQLVVLQLMQCTLESIEPLSWIHMPKIQKICLEINFITNFKPLQKCLFKPIKDISLKQNFITHNQFRYLNSLFFIQKKTPSTELVLSLNQEQNSQNEENPSNSLNENQQELYEVNIKISLTKLINLPKQQFLLYANGNYFQSNFKYIFDLRK